MSTSDTERKDYHQLRFQSPAVPGLASDRVMTEILRQRKFENIERNARNYKDLGPLIRIFGNIPEGSTFPLPNIQDDDPTLTVHILGFDEYGKAEFDIMDENGQIQTSGALAARPFYELIGAFQFTESGSVQITPLGQELLAQQTNKR
jgi:hypothetical protein